jgi:hypothetical protein
MAAFKVNDSNGKHVWVVMGSIIAFGVNKHRADDVDGSLTLRLCRGGSVTVPPEQAEGFIREFELFHEMTSGTSGCRIRLLKAIKAAGHTQSSFATMLNIPYSTLNQIVQGKLSVNTKKTKAHVERITNVLEMSREELELCP